MAKGDTKTTKPSRKHACAKPATKKRATKKPVAAVVTKVLSAKERLSTSDARTLAGMALLGISAPPAKSVEFAALGSTWSYFDTDCVTLSAGTYYIGDVCYALGDAEEYEYVYGAQVDKKKESYDDGLYSAGDDKFFFVGRTYDGDGSFKGMGRREFLVDAGNIGIIPKAFCCKKAFTKDGGIHGGHFFDFAGPVKCKFAGGVFNFESVYDGRSYKINTRYD
jgi:hypothetical protein